MGMKTAAGEPCCARSDRLISVHFRLARASTAGQVRLTHRILLKCPVTI
jgi:hypothetical protein